MHIIYSIVVTYNGEKWIEKCLNSLIISTVKIGIIVIDNNSGDNTLSILESKYSTVMLVKSPQNLGFGIANNIGLRIALQNKADYVLLLNQDSWINPDSVEKMLGQFLSNPGFGIIAPVNMNIDASGLETGFQSELSYENCPGFVSDAYLNQKKDLYLIKNYINASCWLISRACIMSVGGFDPLFSHYGEDINYCMRARYHSFSVGVSILTHSYHARDNYIHKAGKFLMYIKKGRTRYINNYLLPKLTNLELHYFKFYFEELIVLFLLLLKSILSIKKIILYFSIIGFLVFRFFKIARHRQISKKRQPSFIG
jgi:GT2 family glycosyltransferase